MENQHRLIKGYRELTQVEIDLMNRIKAKGREMLELQKEVLEYLDNQVKNTEWSAELEQHLEHTTPNRWAALAKTDMQTATMFLVRAVAQPTD
jgi:hypothetical protein